MDLKRLLRRIGICRRLAVYWVPIDSHPNFKGGADAYDLLGNNVGYSEFSSAPVVEGGKRWGYNIHSTDGRWRRYIDIVHSRESEEAAQSALARKMGWLIIPLDEVEDPKPPRVLGVS